jgi:hypothetical protein
LHGPATCEARNVNAKDVLRGDLLVLQVGWLLILRASDRFIVAGRVPCLRQINRSVTAFDGGAPPIEMRVTSARRDIVFTSNAQ